LKKGIVKTFQELVTKSICVRYAVTFNKGIQVCSNEVSLNEEQTR